MPGAVRLGDTCTGHGCWPSRANTEASDNVIINGKGVHRVGDAWASHTCPSIPETHASTMAQGSPTVFVNGKPKARIGDAIACGSSAATGSSNVIVNAFTINPPPSLSTQDQQNHSDFIEKYGIGSKCDLTKIPSVMLAQGWYKSAEFLTHWFNSTGTNKTINWSWLERFAVVNKAVDELLNPDYLFSENAKKEIIKRLQQHNLLTNRREQINPTGDIESLHQNWHFQYKSNTDVNLDAIGSALGKFNIYAIPYGYVEPALPQGYHVKIEKIDIYIRDSFDFEDALLPQPLAAWNIDAKSVKEVSISNDGYCNLWNSDFRDWRDVYNKGVDYLIYSLIKHIDIDHDGFQI